MVAEHMRGRDNVVADALSRDNLSLACSVIQGSEDEAEEVAQRVLALLVTKEPNWSGL